MPNKSFSFFSLIRSLIPSATSSELITLLNIKGETLVELIRCFEMIIVNAAEKNSSHANEFSELLVAGVGVEEVKRLCKVRKDAARIDSYRSLQENGIVYTQMKGENGEPLYNGYDDPAFHAALQRHMEKIGFPFGYFYQAYIHQEGIGNLLFQCIKDMAVLEEGWDISLDYSSNDTVELIPIGTEALQIRQQTKINKISYIDHNGSYNEANDIERDYFFLIITSQITVQFNSETQSFHVVADFFQIQVDEKLEDNARKEIQNIFPGNIDYVSRLKKKFSLNLPSIKKYRQEMADGFKQRSASECVKVIKAFPETYDKVRIRQMIEGVHAFIKRGIDLKVTDNGDDLLCLALKYEKTGQLFMLLATQFGQEDIEKSLERISDKQIRDLTSSLNVHKILDTYRKENYLDNNARKCVVLVERISALTSDYEEQIEKDIVQICLLISKGINFQYKVSKANQNLLDLLIAMDNQDISIAIVKSLRLNLLPIRDARLQSVDQKRNETLCIQEIKDFSATAGKDVDNSIETIVILVQRGVSYKITDENNNNLLHLALEFDKSGKLFIALAEKMGVEIVSELLQQANATGQYVKDLVFTYNVHEFLYQNFKESYWNFKNQQKVVNAVKFERDSAEICLLCEEQVKLYEDSGVKRRELILSYIELLIQNGLNLQYQNGEGNTWLHMLDPNNRLFLIFQKAMQTQGIFEKVCQTSNNKGQCVDLKTVPDPKQNAPLDKELLRQNAIRFMGILMRHKNPTEEQVKIILSLMKLELANRAIDFDYKNEEEESLLTLAAEYPDKTVYSSLKASFGRG